MELREHYVGRFCSKGTTLPDLGSIIMQRMILAAMFMQIIR